MARFYGVQWMVTDFCQFKVAVKTRKHLSSRMPTCPLVEYRKFKRLFRAVCAVAGGGTSVGLARFGRDWGVIAKRLGAFGRIDGCSAAPFAAISRRSQTWTRTWIANVGSRTWTPTR